MTKNHQKLRKQQKHYLLKSYIFSHTIQQNSYMFQSFLDNIQEGVFYIN